MHETNLLEDQPIAWTPTPDVIERSQLTKFMKQVGVSTWDELYEFSIGDVEKFTEEVLKFLDIKFDPPFEKLLDTSGGIELPKWFISPPRRGDAEAETRPVRSVLLSEPRAVATGSPADHLETSDSSELSPRRRRGGTPPKQAVELSSHRSVPRAVATGSPADQSPTEAHAGLNITTMCLDRWQPSDPWNQTTPAVIWEGEDGVIQTYDYFELLEEVESCAAGLRFRGFEKGDAIGIHLPMLVETVVALLAINRIGAIAVPVFSGYGVDAIASRMNAVCAKALFTCRGFSRRGKFVDALRVAREAIETCPSIVNVFVVGESFPKNSNRPVFEGYDILLDFDAAPSDAEPTSAEDPLIILYTSGTTGKPKGIAHTHGSFPIKAAQDMAFGTDVGRGTRISWYTDIGWMMGPWLIYGALINGATICIYDGAPDYPTPDRMWEFCAKHKVEILGISPTLVRALAAHEGSRSSTTPTSQSLGHPSLDKEGSLARNSPPVLGGVAAASADGVVRENKEESLAQNSPPVLGGVAAAS
ncbi:MAG: AMP-binding protein, partial [Pyrinomonadaceae bacterium]